MAVWLEEGYSIISVQRLEDLMVLKFCWLDLDVIIIISITSIAQRKMKLTVGMVMIHHKRTPCLNLCPYHNFWVGTVLLLVTPIQCLTLSTVDISHSWCLIQAEQWSITIRLHALHVNCNLSLQIQMKNEIGLTREVEEIWNPQSIKQVPGTGFLLAMVLSQINELHTVHAAQKQQRGFFLFKHLRSPLLFDFKVWINSPFVAFCVA